MVCGLLGNGDGRSGAQSGCLENICGSSVLCFDGLCFMSLFLCRSTLFYGFMTDHSCPVVTGKEHSWRHWGNGGKTGD